MPSWAGMIWVLCRGALGGMEMKKSDMMRNDSVGRGQNKGVVKGVKRRLTVDALSVSMTALLRVRVPVPSMV